MTLVIVKHFLIGTMTTVPKGFLFTRTLMTKFEVSNLSAKPEAIIRRPMQIQKMELSRYGLRAVLVCFVLFGSKRSVLGQSPHDIARQRAEHIVARMTLQEKIDQLHGVRTSSLYRNVPGN